MHTATLVYLNRSKEGSSTVGDGGVQSNIVAQNRRWWIRIGDGGVQ